jgi:DNA mismatch repair protein MutL
MPKISILPELLINKIAAGEVIERPASIVRELIDNSIDAGAKRISVDVLHGGKKLIRVIDDGTGIDKDDVSLCFERHATSKVKSEEDLFNITTLGFRGEALASIASVSKVTLITSSVDSQIGTKIEITSGYKKEISEAPPMHGTNLEIRDIFYNTPARRKFLKSTPTELSHIIETVIQKAFAYPEISFSLTHNQSEILNVSTAKNLKERFIQLYGEEFVSEFVEIAPSPTPLPQGKEAKGRGIELYGFSSVAEFARSTKNYQYIFINRRPVKNPTVSHAVYNAYMDLLPKDKHPAFFLFLDINPEKVDVNVHPAKREVRFESPEEIHRLVESTLRDVLSSKLQKDIRYAQLNDSQLSMVSGQQSYGNQAVRETLESAVLLSEGLQPDFFESGVTPSIQKYFYIGESFAAEVTGNGLTIIDQHAAHERILYEKFLKKTSLEIENLFLPIRVELPVREFNIVMNYKDLLHDFGFDIEEFGVNNVIVRTVAKELRKADIKGLLIDIASGIIEEETTGIKTESQKQNLLRNIASRLACHKSVRGKEPLNNEELSQLIADLEKTEAPDKCPHGRPTRVFFSLNDLRKMFKRK